MKSKHQYEIETETISEGTKYQLYVQSTPNFVAQGPHLPSSYCK
jgi:hypothetical protein